MTRLSIVRNNSKELFYNMLLAKKRRKTGYSLLICQTTIAVYADYCYTLSHSLYNVYVLYKSPYVIRMEYNLSVGRKMTYIVAAR